MTFSTFNIYGDKLYLLYLVCVWFTVWKGCAGNIGISEFNLFGL